MKNNFTKIIIKNNIRIYLSNLQDLANKILSYHKYPPLPAIILGNSLAVFSPMKFIYDCQKLMVRIKSNGPIKSLIMEIKDNNVRSLISDPNIVTEYDNKNYNDIPLILGLGDEGSLEISRKIKNEYFNSITKLVRFDIVTDLAYFLNVSDQIFSAILSDVELSKDNPLFFSKARSIIFQLLPEHTEEDKKWIENFIANINIKSLTINEIEEKIQGTLLETKNLSSKCWCSKEKMIKAILLLPIKEQKELKKESLEIKCEFCLKKITIKKEDFLS